MLYALIGLTALFVVAVFAHAGDKSPLQRRLYDQRHRSTEQAFGRRSRI